MDDVNVGGTYIQAAVLCERVLEERDGMLTPVRITDGLVRRGPKIFDYQMTALVIVRAGEGVRGEIPVRIELQMPSGNVTAKATMRAKSIGQNLVFNMNVTFSESGLHWFNVYLQGELTTRMPFRVVST